jgi:IS30 family transposase
LVERTALFVTLAKLADGTAKSAVAGFSRVLNRIDAQKRLSLNYDQGKEMAATSHSPIEPASKCASPIRTGSRRSQAQDGSQSALRICAAR